MTDRERLRALHRRELEYFGTAHRASAELFARAAEHMPHGVPMSWMAKWPGNFPVFVTHASGAHFTDADGHDYIDFCLGDTGAMAGHAPDATVLALTSALPHGMTTMLPSTSSIDVSTELARRFGLPFWQFTLSATDANRHAIRYARALTGRGRIVVHDYCYHGSVDETFATQDVDGSTVNRRSNIGAPVDTAETTIVIPFNDIDALAIALATGDVAAVLIEPALTNVGIVLPDAGYHEAVRELCDRYGALLIVDETHTLCAGPGGYTAANGLTPDILVVGKAIGGGIPCGAFGMTASVAERVQRIVALEDIDVGGIGGTLAGNTLSMTAMAATLESVLTDDAFDVMIPLAKRWADGVSDALDEYAVPWHVTRLGCRAEYGFSPEQPRDGAQAASADDFELQQFLHLYALNRGILLTPFHNIALMCPDTTDEDVDAHTAMFRECLAELSA